MTATHYFTGLASGLALIVAIGAQNTFVLRQGIRRQHVLPVALLCIAADALLISLGIAGLGALLRSHPAWIDIARQAGALFLLAYAGHAFRRALIGQQSLDESGEGATLRVALLSCLGFTFLNPHTYLDTVVLLGALGNQQGEEGRWLFGAGAITASLLWFFALAYGARLLSPLFRRPVAWRVLDSLIALTLLALALNLFGA